MIKYKTLISTVTFWLFLREIWRKKAGNDNTFKAALSGNQNKITKFSKILPNATSIKH